MNWVKRNWLAVALGAIWGATAVFQLLTIRNLAEVTRLHAAELAVQTATLTVQTEILRTHQDHLAWIDRQLGREAGNERW